MTKIAQNSKEDLTDLDLGLGEDNSIVNNSVEKADNALKNAAATAALKAAVEANSELANREAIKTYINEKKKTMLNRCKSDTPVKFVGNKLLANYFGKVYTFLYNTIPVTVRFDGTEQEFPKFIYDRLMQKIYEVSESNTNKVVIENRAEDL